MRRRCSPISIAPPEPEHPAIRGGGLESRLLKSVGRSAALRKAHAGYCLGREIWDRPARAGWRAEDLLGVVEVPAGSEGADGAKPQRRKAKGERRKEKGQKSLLAGCGRRSPAGGARLC